MNGFSSRIEQYRIGFLGLSFLILSLIFVFGGPMDIASEIYGIMFISLIAPFVLLAALFRSFMRAAAPTLCVVASLGFVHAAASINGYSRESVEALFFLTLVTTGGTVARASVAIMTNVTKFGRCDPDELPIKEIARYGFAAFLAGVVALGDIFLLGGYPMSEVISIILVAMAAPLFGFGMFFFLLMDKAPADEEAVAHHNRLLRRAEAFESVGKAAQTKREGLGLFLFMVPLFGLVVAVYTRTGAFSGFASDMLLVIAGLTGVALYAGRSIRSAFVMGLSISMFTGLLGFFLSTRSVTGSQAAEVFAALSAATTVLLPPCIYLYKLCEYHLLDGKAMRTVLMTAAVRGVAMFILTAGLFVVGAIPWMTLATGGTGMFAFLFASFLTLGAVLVPLFGLSLFAMVEELFPRRELIRHTV